MVADVGYAYEMFCNCKIKTSCVTEVFKRAVRSIARVQSCEVVSSRHRVVTAACVCRYHRGLERTIIFK
jgi:hypothetical protein